MRYEYVEQALLADLSYANFTTSTAPVYVPQEPQSFSLAAV